MRAGYDIRHITLTLMREDLALASLILAETETFAPDERPLLESELPEVPGTTFVRGFAVRGGISTASRPCSVTCPAIPVTCRYWCCAVSS